MDLKYVYGGYQYSVDTIMAFTGSDMTDFWSEPVFYFFQDIDKEKYKALDSAGRRTYLEAYFSDFEKENKALLEKRVQEYNDCWEQYRPQITEAFEEAFSIDLSDLFNDMCSYITFNPISPRYLEKHTFDMFYLNSERGALGLTIHELIHFVWFYVWNKHFNDNAKAYETPHLKWILSEMVVEPIMRDERLGGINPYYQDNSCVYPYFYTMDIDGKNVLDTLFEMYKAMPIEEFMEKSYQFCLEHEQEIRGHIEKSENSFG